MSVKSMRKSFTASDVKFDRDGSQGEFLAEFAKLSVVDKDGDVLLPGILGQQLGDGGEPLKVRISSWGHKWQELPVGRGEVYESDGKLYCQGKFFLDTAGGLETYKTVKGLAELAEWSFGFDILLAEPGQFEGKQVRYLKSVRVFEVSPVLQGAGVDTHTVDMKNKKQWNVDAVYDAWRVAHPYVQGEESSYIAEIRVDPNSVIVDAGKDLFMVPFSVDASSNVSFDEARSVEVVRTYVPVEDTNTTVEGSVSTASAGMCEACTLPYGDCMCETGKSMQQDVLLQYEVTRSKLLGVIE